MTWALWFGLGGLFFSVLLYVFVKRQSDGDAGMQELAAAIQSGAMAFLRREYSVLVPFVLIVAAMLYWLIGPSSAAAYVFGAGWLYSLTVKGLPASRCVASLKRVASWGWALMAFCLIIQ